MTVHPSTLEELRYQVSWVRFGSEADAITRISNVRFTPKSGHAQRLHRCPVSASTDIHRRSRKKALRRERPLTDQLSGHTLFAPAGLYCRQKPLRGSVLRRDNIHAEDALLAALKVKGERPDATIMYVRRLNRRGDTRHPPHTLTGGRNPNRSVSG